MVTFIESQVFYVSGKYLFSLILSAKKSASYLWQHSLMTLGRACLCLPLGKRNGASTYSLLVRIEGKLNELSTSITELAKAIAVLEMKAPII